MMTNLFSMFDPSTNIYNLNLSLNWMSCMFLMILIPNKYWMLKNNLMLIYYKLINILYNEFKVIMFNNKKNNFNLMFISLFIFIMINNFMGLFPYIFTSTSHLVINLTLCFPLWISLMLYGWINKINHMFTHLVPQGTPNVLIPFMVMIESISNVIRPITLTVRLTANMIAGHLLLTLLSNMGHKLSIVLMPILISIQMILLTLESAVSIIQAYVFAVLMTLYSSEI